MSSTGPADSQMLGHGFFFEEMTVGKKFHTKGRTLTLADMNAFVNLTWFTEELFVNAHDTEHHAIKGGQLVPAGMIFTFAEGMVTQSMERTGLAFLNMTYDVKKPTFIGDTIHVQVEVVEARATSSGDRGLVRTRNDITNQNGDVVLSYSPLRLVRMKPKA